MKAVQMGGRALLKGDSVLQAVIDAGGADVAHGVASKVLDKSTISG